MFDLRIENGIVVTPEKSMRTNVYVIDGKIAELSGIHNFHDLRMVSGHTRTNVVFDLTVDPEAKVCKAAIEALLDQKVREYNPSFRCVIDYDINYLKNC